MKVKTIAVFALSLLTLTLASSLNTATVTAATGKPKCVTAPCDPSSSIVVTAPILSRTKAPQPKCVTYPCSEVAGLVWTANPADESVTEYNLYRDGVLRATIPATSGPITFNDTVGGSEITYTYFVRAVSPYGTTDSGSVTYTTKIIFDTRAPSTPTNLRADYVEVNGRWGARLTWTASTDNIRVDHYDITRLNNNSRESLGFTVSGSQTSYDDLMFNINTGGMVNFEYLVEAVDVASNRSAYSVPTNFPPGTTLATEQVTVGNRYGARLTWTPVADTQPVGYYIIKRTDTGGGVGTEFTVAPDVNRYDDLMFSINTGADVTFFYRITAYDQYGNFMYTSNFVTFANSSPVLQASPTKKWLATSGYSVPRPR